MFFCLEIWEPGLAGKRPSRSHLGPPQAILSMDPKKKEKEHSTKFVGPIHPLFCFPDFLDSASTRELQELSQKQFKLKHRLRVGCLTVSARRVGWARLCFCALRSLSLGANTLDRHNLTQQMLKSLEIKCVSPRISTGTVSCVLLLWVVCFR